MCIRHVAVCAGMLDFYVVLMLRHVLVFLPIPFLRILRFYVLVASGE